MKTLLKTMIFAVSTMILTSSLAMANPSFCIVSTGNDSDGLVIVTNCDGKEKQRLKLSAIYFDGDFTRVVQQLLTTGYKIVGCTLTSSESECALVK